MTLTFAAPSGANPLAVTFNVPLASVTTLPAGTQLALTLTNLTPNIPTQRIRVFPTQGGDFSRIELPALTVINVDSAATFAGAYPAAVAQSSFVPGAVVSLRATVSDPFGRFDIARVEIDLSDPLGNVVAAAAPMTPVAAVSEAAGIYEYLLTLPATAAPGNWDYRLTAIEGSEGLIRHSFSGSFAVGGARVLVTKSAQTVADPINGGANPKAIPGAVVLYSLSVANNGAIATDADSVVITDALPDNVALYVEAAGGDPVVFLDGSPGSGLSFDYAADVSYSSAPGGGPPFSHAPAPDASGFDAAITGIRINPSGALGADSGAGTPAFELRYRVRID